MSFPKGLLTLSKLISIHGIEDVVVCPGSRNAPIIHALHLNPALKLYSIVDERSAAFFALGRALACNKPVVICCTSGSAGLNLGPALAEAFYQEIPLLAITADRPAEWIDQWDGQTIKQTNFLATTVKKSLEFPSFAQSEDTLKWYQERISNEALLSLVSDKKGPVHLNVPISEPFYPTKGETFALPENVHAFKVSESKSLPEGEILDFLSNNYQNEQKIILSIGQIEEISDLKPYLKQLKSLGVVLIGDSTSNASEFVVQNHDLILANDKIWEKLSSELVIHIGRSHVSKRIKQFFRKQTPKQNWLIKTGSNDSIIDTYQSLTHLIAADSKLFLKVLCDFLSGHKLNLSYYSFWGKYSIECGEIQHTFLDANKNWNELHAVQKVLNSISQSANPIHIGNSLSIRYSNWLPFFPKGSVYCNRGTSGIDGCVSTYIGSTCSIDTISFLLIGDLSFQYDKNGLWNKYLHTGHRIIILNNSGGGIFRNLEGAKDLHELEDYISTKQENSAEFTALENGFDYLKAENSNELQHQLEIIQKASKKPIILEIFTNPDDNKEILANYMGLFKS